MFLSTDCHMLLFILVVIVMGIVSAGGPPGTSSSQMTGDYKTARMLQFEQRDEIIYSVLSANPEWTSAEIFDAVQPMIKAAGLKEVSYRNLLNQLVQFRKALNISRPREVIPADQIAFMKAEMKSSPGITASRLSRRLFAVFGPAAVPYTRVATWVVCTHRSQRYSRTNDVCETTDAPIHPTIPMAQETFLKGVVGSMAGSGEGFREAYAALVGEFGPAAVDMQSAYTAWLTFVNDRDGSAPARSTISDAHGSPTTGHRSRSHLPVIRASEMSAETYSNFAAMTSNQPNTDSVRRDSIIASVLEQHPTWGVRQIFDAAEPLGAAAGLNPLRYHRNFQAKVRRMRNFLNISKERDTLSVEQNAFLRSAFAKDPIKAAIDWVVPIFKQRFPDVPEYRIRVWWSLAHAEAVKRSQAHPNGTSDSSRSPSPVLRGRAAWTKRHSEILKEVDQVSNGTYASYHQVHRKCSKRFAAEHLTPLSLSTFTYIARDHRLGSGVATASPTGATPKFD